MSSPQTTIFPLVFALYVAVLAVVNGTATGHHMAPAKALNEIDKCWRWNPNWHNQRQQLAACSAGYAGKMTGNAAPDLIHYVVTDPSDHPLDPQPGTLRFGVTRVQGKVWITFQHDMTINLQKPLLLRSFTAIDGRGTTIHITGMGCLFLKRVTNVIIHGLKIHHCKAGEGGQVMGPEGKIVDIGAVDGDAIRMLTSSKVWIDHNTLYRCEDGVLDATRGSTNVTISNNWFRSQNKVMLLGHDDGYLRDKSMRVTVAYNHFGPNCRQRMPRVRYGYAHVVNNLYKGWGLYAIGGSMNPSIKSQANLFIAPETGNKEVTWRQHKGDGMGWKINSVDDVFENGASFLESGKIMGGGWVKPNYTAEQRLEVAPATSVRSLTRSSGALRCLKTVQC